MWDVEFIPENGLPISSAVFQSEVQGSPGGSVGRSGHALNGHFFDSIRLFQKSRRAVATIRHLEIAGTLLTSHPSNRTISMSQPEPYRAPQPAMQKREPMFNLPGIVILLLTLCTGIHLLRTYVLTTEQDFDLIIRAAFVPIRYSGEFVLDSYAFTSPFTYALLHGSFAHLAVNMVWMAAFGAPLANRMGTVRFAIFFAVTSLAAAFFYYAIHPLGQSPLVGASGAISGMMGAAARFAFRIDRSSGKGAFAGDPLPMREIVRSRSVVTFLAVWMVINLVTGIAGFVPGEESQIAWEAHIGGFLAGFFGLRLFEAGLRRRF